MMLFSSSDSIPVGFEVWHDHETESVFILHRRTGMKAMNGFLIVWLACWTACCVFLIGSYLKGLSGSAERIPLWFVALFLIMELSAAWFLTYSLCARKVYVLGPHELIVETSLFKFKWMNIIPRERIKQFRQVKDGGEDDDSVPSWGLEVESDKRITLLHRQAYAKSHWLGTVLAEWAGVLFIEVPKR
jgi:hypothetical protein